MAGPFGGDSSSDPGFSAQPAASNCQAKLAGNSYDCTNNDGEGKFSDCMEFITGGESIHFDLVDFVSGQVLGCGCLPTGSVNAPKLDSSASSFVCAGIGFQFGGKVSGTSIKGQASLIGGGQEIFSCKKRSSSC
jgi:hypothetical protein